MKNSLILLLVFTSLQLLNSCSSDGGTTPPVDVISTDISVTASSNLITWTDKDDLDTQLESIISFNSGRAPANAVIQTLTVNADSTRADAAISFRPTFSGLYTDTNSSNNSVSVQLEKAAPTGNGAIVLSANGPGNTYDLITSVLAPGHNPIEVPDCGHASFGDHIDELFDAELNKNVFRFLIHTADDNDRCINFDRQRNEIKSYDKSPDNLLGIQNETVEYKWKFKLAAGFQSSPKFTHIHQLKSVGGSLESMPMYTLTTRKGSPDKLELRYAETSSQITLDETAIAPFVDTWVEVTEKIKYSTAGTYEIVIKKVSDGTTLFEYSNNSLINWRPGGDFVRPKWGIYRSLVHATDLRDEEVLFADFSVEEY